MELLRFSSSSRPTPAGHWALLWLGGSAAAAWIPLLLVDVLPWSTSTAVPTLPQAINTPAGLQTPPPPKTLEASLPLAFAAAQAPSSHATFRNTWLESVRPVSSNLVLPAPHAGNKTANLEPPPSPSTPRPVLSGSMLLGGPLSLASLHEKPMVPAARLERTLRAASSNRLEAIPPHWRPTMEALIQGQKQVQPAEMVRLPAPHLKSPEEYPMAVLPDGVAETPVTPSAPSRQTLERWAQRQQPSPEGGVRPVMVVLEPLASDPSPELVNP